MMIRLLEKNPGLIGVRVFSDIGERFLNDSIDLDLHFNRKLGEAFILDDQVRLNAILRAVLRQVVRQHRY